VQDLGKRLRELRTERALTLAQLGQEAGLSASYLSQIERGVTTPSLASLADLARALNIDVGLFFEDDVSPPCVVRASQGRRLAGSAGTTIELLSADLTDKRILPYRLVCQPGQSGTREPGESGEECCFILEGQLTLTVGDETFVLETGDSIHYQKNLPQIWRNCGDSECAVMWAVSPPVPKAEIAGSLKGGKEVV
jgi:transcriptional regulator with XRE-family HTH domain